MCRTHSALACATLRGKLAAASAGRSASPSSPRRRRMKLSLAFLQTYVEMTVYIFSRKYAVAAEMYLLFLVAAYTFSNRSGRTTRGQWRSKVMTWLMTWSTKTPSTEWSAVSMRSLSEVLFCQERKMTSRGTLSTKLPAEWYSITL